MSGALSQAGAAPGAGATEQFGLRQRPMVALAYFRVSLKPALVYPNLLKHKKVPCFVRSIPRTERGSGAAVSNMGPTGPRVSGICSVSV